MADADSGSGNVANLGGRGISAEAEKVERALVDADQWQNQMDAIGAKSSFDVRLHATRLLRPEFKE